MGDIELRKMDISILLIFLGIMKHGRASDVAGELGLTPSAVSHAIKRLRDIYGDELFIRRPRGLEPTAFARALEPSIAGIVSDLRDSLSPPATFDPLRSTDTVRIAALDYELCTIVPSMFRRIHEKAPRVKVSAENVGRQAAIRGLTEGQIDIALGLFSEPNRETEAHPLYEEDYAVVGRPDLLAEKTLSLSTYLKLDHLVVSQEADFHGVVDAALDDMGHARNVVFSIPLFLPALSFLATNTLVATLPTRLAERYHASFGLTVRTPPVELRAFRISCLIHRRNHRSPLHNWLVEIAHEAAGAID